MKKLLSCFVLSLACAWASVAFGANPAPAGINWEKLSSFSLSGLGDADDEASPQTLRFEPIILVRRDDEDPILLCSGEGVVTIDMGATQCRLLTASTSWEVQ